MLLKTQSQLLLKSHERSLPLQLVDKSLPKNWPVLRSNRLKKPPLKKLKVIFQSLHYINISRKRRRSSSWRSQRRSRRGSCWRNSRRKGCFRRSRRRRSCSCRGSRSWRGRRARRRSWSRITRWGYWSRRWRSCGRDRRRGNYRCRGWNSCRACRVSGVTNLMLELLLAVQINLTQSHQMDFFLPSKARKKVHFLLLNIFAEKTLLIISCRKISFSQCLKWIKFHLKKMHSF